MSVYNSPNAFRSDLSVQYQNACECTLARRIQLLCCLPTYINSSAGCCSVACVSTLGQARTFYESWNSGADIVSDQAVGWANG